MLPLVKMQMSAAIFKARSAISRAGRSVFCISAPPRGQRVVAARADGQNAVIRFDDLARAADEQKIVLVSAQKHSLQFAHGLVHAPVLRQFTAAL